VTDSAYLDARYGRRARHPGRARVLAVVGVTVLVALVAGLFLWSRAGGGVSATVSSYHVLSDARTSVSFTVDKADGQRVSCRVVAQDRYTDVVGSADVTLPAAKRQVSVWVTVPTRGRAVVALVESCRVLG
jgi:Domain of unknown function (DUF4307)